MKVTRIFSIIFIVSASLSVAVSGADSTTTILPDSLKSSTKLTVADSITAPDPFIAFSATNKKYLKKSIITNILYLSGYGLLFGVVVPGVEKEETSMDQLKWYPLNFLSVGMMYASLPINVLSSYRARSNYKYYYKTAPTNYALPIILTGSGVCIGSVGVTLWNSISDYRDNKEIDGSYNKYGKLSNGLLAAGFITLGGSNLYSLLYTIILEKKAKQQSTASNSAPAPAALYITPVFSGEANGCMLTWYF